MELALYMLAAGLGEHRHEWTDSQKDRFAKAVESLDALRSADADEIRAALDRITRGVAFLVRERGRSLDG